MRLYRCLTNGVGRRFYGGNTRWTCSSCFVGCLPIATNSLSQMPEALFPVQIYELLAWMKKLDAHPPSRHKYVSWGGQRALQAHRRRHLQGRWNLMARAGQHIAWEGVALWVSLAPGPLLLGLGRPSMCRVWAPWTSALALWLRGRVSDVSERKVKIQPYWIVVKVVPYKAITMLQSKFQVLTLFCLSWDWGWQEAPTLSHLNPEVHMDNPRLGDLSAAPC